MVQKKQREQEEEEAEEEGRIGKRIRGGGAEEA